jgi:hypothetical protein
MSNFQQGNGEEKDEGKTEKASPPITILNPRKECTQQKRSRDNVKEIPVR